MKQRIMLLLLLFSVALFGQEPILKYKDLPAEVKKQVQRSDFRQAVKDYQAEQDKGYEINVSPIDRVITDEETLPTARSLGASELGGWDRDVLAPDGIYDRIGREATKYKTVLVINDSGVDETHPIYAGDWFLPPSNYSGDTEMHFHGTFVLGQSWKLVAPLAMNGSLQLKSAQLLNRNGSGSFSAAVNLVSVESALFKPRADDGQGIFFCNSWGATIPKYAPLENQLKASYHPNMFWNAAAGNSGGPTDSYPASSDWMTSTPALTASLVRASYSTIASWNDISAPGSNVRSTMPGGGLGTGNGTSYAAPLYTAEQVIAFGKYGEKLSGENMPTYMNHIATDISPNGFDNETGHGLVFVQAILDTDPCDVPGVDCNGDTPDDPDDPQEPTNPDLFYASGLADDGFTMPWQYEGEGGFRYLQVPEIEFQVVGEVGEQEAYEEAQAFITKFFQNRAIVLLPDMDWYSATKWTGRFINLVSKNEGIAIEVVKITGKGPGGLSYVATDFSWTPNAFAERIQGVYVKDLE